MHLHLAANRAGKAQLDRAGVGARVHLVIAQADRVVRPVRAEDPPRFGATNFEVGRQQDRQGSRGAVRNLIVQERVQRGGVGAQVPEVSLPELDLGGPLCVRRVEPGQLQRSGHAAQIYFEHFRPVLGRDALRPGFHRRMHVGSVLGQFEAELVLQQARRGELDGAVVRRAADGDTEVQLHLVPAPAANLHRITRLRGGKGGDLGRATVEPCFAVQLRAVQRQR